MRDRDNVEVWRDSVYDVDCRCGTYQVNGSSVDAIGYPYPCPSCGKDVDKDHVRKTGKTALFFWTCWPGCLPDSETQGPYESESECEDAMSDFYGDWEDEQEDAQETEKEDEQEDTDTDTDTDKED